MADGAVLAAVQPGGASSNFLGPDRLDVRLDFGTLAEAGSMLGSGAMVVMAEGTDLLAAATNVLRVLPRRVLRQVRALPGRVAKAHTLLAQALAAGGGAGREPAGAAARPRGGAAPDLDLRARPGGARPRRQRAGSRARRDGGAPQPRG